MSTDTDPVDMAREHRRDRRVVRRSVAPTVAKLRDGVPANSVRSRTRPTTTIGVVLLPPFDALATMAFLDPFRAVNYLRGGNLYSWET